MTNAQSDVIVFDRHLKEARAYWLETIPAELEPTALWSPRRKSAETDPATETIDLTITDDTFQALKGLTGGDNFLIYTALVTALSICLHRYTGKTTIVVGSPARRQRNHPDQPANAVPIVQDIRSTDTFRDRLLAVRETLLTAYAHQHYPFTHLISDLERAEGAERGAVFDVAVALEDIHTELPETGHSITLTFANAGDHLAGVVLYRTDVFERTRVQRFAEHFRSVLAAALNNTDRRVAEVQMLSDDTRRQFVSTWNDTAHAYPNVPVHHLFEEQVARTPTAIAAECAGDTLSYRHLNERANQVAHYLKAQGIGPDTPVGLYMERSLDLLVAIFGILKAGGAYVPLDPAYPAERLRFILGETDAPLIVTQQRCVADLPAGTSSVFILDGEWNRIADRPTSKPNVSISPENLAYIMYTSGSTGRPKGIAVPHRGLVNYLTWAAEAYEVEGGVGSPVHSSIGFDLTVTSLYLPLLTGRQAILLPDGDGIEALRDAVQHRTDFSLLKLTPSHLELLQEWLAPDAAAGRAGALVIGGEALHEEMLSFFREHMPGTRLINEYGPTETVVGCCVFEASDVEPTSGPVPIGRPIANTRLYVLNDAMQPMPVGTPGELYVGGAGVARGYVNRPALTAKRFVPDPFGDNAGARLYKTGDLVRYLPDGTLEFLGRTDHQVKVRGYRIELGEIEAVLRRHESVQRSIVTLYDGEDATFLVAYVLPTDVTSPDEAELRAFLLDMLPDYMVPAQFVVVESLPLTTNGKVDRDALPAPQLGGDDGEPRSEIEKALATLWADVLEQERVGIHDNFFSLGGDSIRALQLVAQARTAGYSLTSQDIFEHHTIANIAALLEDGDDIQPTVDVPAHGEVPPTPIQHWFFTQDLPTYHHWNQAFLFELAPAVDLQRFEHALNHVIGHYDVFRLRFVREEDTWTQSYADDAGTVTVQQIDVSEYSGNAQVEAIETAATELQSRLDITDGPLLCAGYFHRGDAPARLLLAVHHLIVDGVSWRILLEDLNTAYDQLVHGDPVDLPPASCSFKAWSEHLQAYTDSSAIQEERTYWNAFAKTISEPAPLPQDKNASAATNTEASARVLRASLSTAETAVLVNEIPTTHHARIDNVLLAALLCALREWSERSTFLIDVESHGRQSNDSIDLARAVGWFTSLYPIYLECDAANTPIDMLKVVKEQHRQVPNGGLGYGVLRYLAEESARIEIPRADVAFNYLGQLDQDAGILAFVDEPSGLARHPDGRRTHVLELNALIVDGRLQLRWRYSENLHVRSTIASVADTCMAALRDLIADTEDATDAGYTPSDFALVDLDQRQLDAIAERMSDGQRST